MGSLPSWDRHFRRGDRVRIDCGSTFDGYEGEVTADYEGQGYVSLTIKVFGRDVPLELAPNLLVRLG